MAQLATVKFTGKSGTMYPFNIYPITEECPAEGGIYVFGNYRAAESKITALYIGMAKSFSNRMYDHHKIECAKNNGANVICLMQVNDENKRTFIEKDLLGFYDTKCNEILNPVTPK